MRFNCFILILTIITSISNGFSKTNEISKAEKELFGTIKLPSEPIGVQANIVKLGQLLFHEKRISKHQDMSCSSCHRLDHYGADGKKTSFGHQGLQIARNSPSIIYSSGNFAQFWDSRTASVEEQAKLPVVNAKNEILLPSRGAINLLKSLPNYVMAFKKAFPTEQNPVTYKNLALAIAAFERQLLTPSRFDQYLSGDQSALSAKEKKGLKAFISTGCTMCHNGKLLGGHMNGKLGLIAAWPNQKDQGLYELTKNDADRMIFKIPSLRNVAKTGPYFHDGQTKDLAHAVKLMAKHQLGRQLSDTDTELIVTFLQTLTAKPATDYLEMPKLYTCYSNTALPDFDLSTDTQSFLEKASPELCERINSILNSFNQLKKDQIKLNDLKRNFPEQESLINSRIIKIKEISSEYKNALNMIKREARNAYVLYKLDEIGGKQSFKKKSLILVQKANDAIISAHEIREALEEITDRD